MSEDQSQRTTDAATPLPPGRSPSDAQRSRRRPWWRRRPPLTVLIVLAAVIVPALVWAVLPPRKESTPPRTEKPVNVVTERLEPRETLRDTITVNGVVHPNRIVDVAAEISGRIETFAGLEDTLPAPGEPTPAAEEIRGKRLDEGDTIEAGRPLLYINTDLIKADYDSAKAKYVYDRKEFERTADARRRGVATPTEYDQAESDLAMSKAAFDSAAARLRRAAILAPVSGVVDRLPVDAGEYVVPGTVVAEIVDLDTVKVLVHAAEKDVNYLHIGDEAVVRVDSLDGKQVTGQISYISEQADEQTRTTPVEITIDNPPDAQGKRQLRSGQIVKVELTRRVLTDVIMIPQAAVIPTEEGYLTYVVNSGQAKQRKVELGLIQGHRVQVLSGLEAGEKLIVQGHQYVGPGQKVVERKGIEQ